MPTRKHGYAKYRNPSRVYRIWSGMLNRCDNPNNRSYNRYGGRGIKVCKRWQSFAAFLKDMGEPPTPQHQLERKKNNRHYSPTNCRWATPKEQARNRRSSRLITINGESQPLAVWCEKFGIKSSTVSMRLRNGWPDHKAVTTPARVHKPYHHHTRPEPLP